MKIRPLLGADLGDSESGPDDFEKLIVQLRAYVPGKKAGRRRQNSRTTPAVALIFDTETTTDPSQRLRFGAYQLRHNGKLFERGWFYAADLPDSDLAVLRSAIREIEPTKSGEKVALRTVADFIENIFFAWGFETGAMIIGFNLPFDLSRLAIRHTYAKRDMAGGFSFVLAAGRPNVRVKHLSRRAAFIAFGGENAGDKNPDRGYFVDVKTLAATLTSASHSLGSLAKLLGTTPKSEVDGFDGPLTSELIRYGMNDVQVTWECFEKLATHYRSYGLGAELNQLYSEASLGKAFLDAMGIEPWRIVQPDFPPEVIGQIMSSYFGGRSEVHIRREITPVIHCDFRSMYPTVCTLMGLWRFVIASGVERRDDTEAVRELVETWDTDDLRNPTNWQALTCLVQVMPDDDIFPIRAVYEKDQSATIGLNRLTSDEPMWFTLADVMAAKILSGKVPQIQSAIRFNAREPQSELNAITLEGVAVRPDQDDFYKLLIDQRGRFQSQEKNADTADKARLKSAAQSLKILANSTSYGIFVELVVKTLEAPATVTCYDFRGTGRKVRARKVEEAGRYFHPLLASLITGAARLMLAIAERKTIDQGLDWAFCDTDSLAIADTSCLPATEFVCRVETVRAWFEPLNPYEKKGSILQLEKVNFPPGHDGNIKKLEPVNCLTISAKRYALFNRGTDGEIIIRKASAHGLGHLIAPYPDPNRGERIANIGVELWQEDLWREIIKGFDRGEPDKVDFTVLKNFDQPAASRYAATNQTLIKWFKNHNENVPVGAQVRPFNFLLSFQAKSKMEMAVSDPEALHSPYGQSEFRTRHLDIQAI